MEIEVQPGCEHTANKWQAMIFCLLLLLIFFNPKAFVYNILWDALRNL